MAIETMLSCSIQHLHHKTSQQHSRAYLKLTFSQAHIVLERVSSDQKLSYHHCQNDLKSLKPHQNIETTNLYEGAT